MARFSQKHENELKRLVDNGYTISDIASHFGVSYATAANGLKDLGLKAVRAQWGQKTGNIPESASKGHSPKITKEDLIKFYVEGDLTVGEVAEKFHTTRQTVYNSLERYGIAKQKKSRLKRMFDEQKVKEMMDSNMTATEAARELNCSPASLRAYIKESNIKTRNERYAEALTRENLEKWYIEQNRSLMDIASDIGCNYNTVSHACKKFGLTKTRKQIHDTMKQTMRERYGVDYAMESPAIQEKMRYSRSPEFVEKVEECKRIAPKMMKEGATISDIADALGCSYKKTREVLISLGLFKAEKRVPRKKGGDGLGFSGGNIAGEAQEI